MHTKHTASRENCLILNYGFFLLSRSHRLHIAASVSAHTRACVSACQFVTNTNERPTQNLRRPSVCHLLARPSLAKFLHVHNTKERSIISCAGSYFRTYKKTETKNAFSPPICSVFPHCSHFGCTARFSKISKIKCGTLTSRTSCTAFFPCALLDIPIYERAQKKGAKP